MQPRARKVTIYKTPIRACAHEPSRKGADLLAADVQGLKSTVKTLRTRELAQLRSDLAKQLLERLVRTEGALQRVAESVTVARERIARSIELALLSSDIPGSAAARIRRIVGTDTKLRTLSFFTWQRVPLDLPSQKANRIQREQRSLMIQAVKDASEAPLWQSIAKFGARAVVLVTDVATSGAKRHSAAVNSFRRSQGGVALAVTVTPSTPSETKQKPIRSRSKAAKKSNRNQQKMKPDNRRSRISKKNPVVSKQSGTIRTKRKKSLDLGSNRLRPRSGTKKPVAKQRANKSAMSIGKPWDLNSYRTRLAFVAAGIDGGKVSKQKENAGIGVPQSWDLSSYRTRLVFVIAGVIGAKALLSAAPLIAIISHAAVVGDVRDPRRWKVHVVDTYATRRSNTVRSVDVWLKSRQHRQPRMLPALPQARVANLTKPEIHQDLEIESNLFLEAESQQVGIKAPAVLDKPVIGYVLRGVDEVAYFVETRLQRAVRRWNAAAGVSQDSNWSVLRVFEWQRDRERENDS